MAWWACRATATARRCPSATPQAAFHAGAQAAADAVVALCERDRSGLGQHLDVSMLACMVWTLMHATGFPPLEGRDPPGTGEQRAASAGFASPITVAGLELPTLLRCVDGLVLITIASGPAGWQTLANALAWLDEEQGLPEPIKAVDWFEWQTLYEQGELPFDTAKRGDQAGGRPSSRARPSSNWSSAPCG